MRSLTLAALTLTAIAAGALVYPGAAAHYFLFSIVFFAVLYSAFLLPFQYTHFFLAIIWFIGFWLKVVLHFAFDRFGFAEAAKYVEPTGWFDGSATTWDAVLLTASIGGMGYLVGRIVVSPAIKHRPTRPQMFAPAWYRQLRPLLWSLVGATLIAILLINAELGLVVRGYVPRFTLPWPLGGLFAWSTDIGIALTIAVLTAWDRSLGAGVGRGFVALCVEGAALSIQTNSRGIYLFHTVPVLVSEARRPVDSWPRIRNTAFLLIAWLIGATAIPLVTTGLRVIGKDALFAHVAVAPSVPATSSAPAIPPQTTEAAAQAGPKLQPASSRGPAPGNSFFYFVQVALKGGSRLVVDRWVGLEGIMSAVSYPDRSMVLFKEAALQRRTFGMVDVYTGKISRSDFTEEQAKTYHNATLAGPIALFYFSGSWLLVFCGMAAVAALMSILEAIWRMLCPDSLVVAMTGLYLALVAMQMSTGVIQVVTGPIAVTALLAIVWAITRAETTSPATATAESR